MYWNPPFTRKETAASEPMAVMMPRVSLMYAEILGVAANAGDANRKSPVVRRRASESSVFIRLVFSVMMSDYCPVPNALLKLETAPDTLNCRNESNNPS